MGYYTYHELKVIQPNTKEAKLTEFLDGGDHHHDAIGELSEYGDNLWDDSVKWYDREKDMSEYSKRYPDILFQIDGNGEEADDIWREYWKEGKVQHEDCQFVFGTYDETKLK